MVTEVQPAHKKIRFVREYPFIGSLPGFLGDRLTLQKKLVAAYGDVFGFHLGPTPVVYLNEPEYVQRVLVDHTNDFDKGRLQHKSFSGNGLFISEGELHRHQRKLIAPVFQPRHIASYADIMTRYAEQLQQNWHDGEIIDVNQQMISITMNIIGKVLFDADIFDETDELGAAFAAIFADITYRITSLFAPPLNWPTRRNRRTLQAIDVVQSRIQRMIDERKQSQDERNDFLSILLRARDEDGKAMSDQQVMDECTTLFSAGHETTAVALSWSWYLLCQHPDVYSKVQQEVDMVLQGRTPTYADLAHLPYSLQVFKESMRLYPPASGVIREALHDIDIDGYRIPKGWSVLIPIYTLHRIPAYFPDPERFDPERFTPARERQLPRQAYMPFGAGPRICIGNHFAMMEGHLLLAALAQRVSFDLVPGQKIMYNLSKTLTLRPYGKIDVTVHRR